MAEIASRTALEQELFLYVPPDRQAFAGAFLSGLSGDELFFLSECLGSCMLIPAANQIDAWDAVCRKVHSPRRGLEDGDHKLVLLREFAAGCGFQVRFR